MGQFLGVENVVVDCTELKYETDLFGPKAPYSGHEKGSPLNNALADASGKRSIVVLDEFEKSAQEVWAALLLITEGG